jgi:hypothetical protein
LCADRTRAPGRCARSLGGLVPSGPGRPVPSTVKSRFQSYKRACPHRVCRCSSAVPTAPAAAGVLDQRPSLSSPLDGVRRSRPSEVALRAGLPPRKRLSQDASRCRSQAFSTSQRFDPTQPSRPCLVPQPSPGFSPSEVSPRRNRARLSAPLAPSRLSAVPPDGVTWALSPVVSSNACLATSSHDSQSHATLARVPHRLRTPFPRRSRATKRGHPRPATNS